MQSAPKQPLLKRIEARLTRNPAIIILALLMSLLAAAAAIITNTEVIVNFVKCGKSVCTVDIPDDAVPDNAVPGDSAEFHDFLLIKKTQLSDIMNNWDTRFNEVELIASQVKYIASEMGQAEIELSIENATNQASMKELANITNKELELLLVLLEADQ